jgi:hypothetical protein
MSVSEQGYMPPQTPTQVVLAEIWSELLEVERVGIRDKFLELGGNSLLAALLIARIYKKFALELPIGVLFEASTVEEIGDRIDKAQQRS